MNYFIVLAGLVISCFLSCNINPPANYSTIEKPFKSVHPILGIDVDSTPIVEKAIIGHEPVITYDNPPKSFLKLPYKDIFRTPESYLNQRFKIKGKILQFFDYGNGYKFLFIYIKWNDYIGYSDNIVCAAYKGNRLVEGDIITVYGLFVNLYEYTTAQNTINTVPLLKVDIIVINQKTEE
jgi:hypothetical protein